MNKAGILAEPDQKVRGVGSFLFRDNLDAISSGNVVQEFLRNTMIDFAKSSAKYYRRLEQFPFNYKERQLDAVLLPAMAKNAEIVSVEEPVSRRFEKETTNTGKLDYWVLQDDFVMLIELKHGYQSMTSKQARSDTMKSWQVAMEQLRSIKYGEKKRLVQTEAGAKIALMVTPLFQGAKDRERIKNVQYDSDRTVEVFNRLCNSLSPKPNWCGLWVLDRGLGPEEMIDRFECYPGVALLAHVEEMRFAGEKKRA